METTNTPTPDCGCDDNCCPPKRKPKWMKYLALLIILGALSIVVVKLVNDHNKPVTKEAAVAKGKACCSDSSNIACDTTKNSSCCPKPGN